MRIRTVRRARALTAGVVVALASSVALSASVSADPPSGTEPDYEPTVESLNSHPQPLGSPALQLFMPDTSTFGQVSSGEPAAVG